MFPHDPGRASGVHQRSLTGAIPKSTINNPASEMDTSDVIESTYINNDSHSLVNTDNDDIQIPNQQNNIDNADRSGILRYFTVINGKRKRNPVLNNNTAGKSKQTDLITNNRFDPLSIDEEIIKKPKPPPIHIRERSTTNLTQSLKSIIKNEYFLVDLKKGALYETKLQLTDETDYTTVTKWLDDKHKEYYSYQSKNQKGLRVVIKGIDHEVKPEDIKADLEALKFKINWVHNIQNKYRQPQPMFKVELAPESSKAPKGKSHPIYDLKYVLRRRITVEEPYKRSGPVQCLNCQEFGHTKTYCKLKTTCAACGKNHHTADCPNDKEDVNKKCCSNCGKNHTANYRGCPVYLAISRTTKTKSSTNQLQQSQPTNMPPSKNNESNSPPIQSRSSQSNFSQTSYANALKNNQPIGQTGNTDNVTQMMMMIVNSIQQLANSIQQMQELQRQQMEILIKITKP